MKKNKVLYFSSSKGFTLIELLVVVAIIGILAAVIVMATTNSRNKGSDARVLSQLKSMVTQADLYIGSRPPVTLRACSNVNVVNSGDNLFGVVSGKNGLGNLMKNLDVANGRCVDTGTAWAVAFPLKSGGAFCVDSMGVSRSKNLAGTKYTGVNTGATPALTGTACN